MNVIRSIWMILTGMDREVGQINGKLDGVAKALTQLSANQAVLAQNQQRLGEMLAQVLAVVSKVQAELSPPPAVALVIKLGGTTQGENGMLKVADSGSVVASLEADDALGNAGASLDGAPEWSVSDESLAKLNVAADGLSAVAVLSGKLGVFQIHVAAKSGGADLAADSDQIEVDPGAAALLKVSVAAAAPAAPSA